MVWSVAFYNRIFEVVFLARNARDYYLAILSRFNVEYSRSLIQDALVKYLYQILIDFTLIEIVEILSLVVYFRRELNSDEPPVPGFKGEILVALRIGEDEAVFVRVFLQPFELLRLVETVERIAAFRRREIECRAELMF